MMTLFRSPYIQCVYPDTLLHTEYQTYVLLKWGVYIIISFILSKL